MIASMPIYQHAARLLPFPQLDQLVHDMDITDQPTFLPGNPRIMLSERTKLDDFLQKDMDLGDLQHLSPRLWMTAIQRSDDIGSLHRQIVRGRKIVVTEEHRLHLVWHQDRIFIKPLPKYMMSARFWLQYILPQRLDGDRKKIATSQAALGFLRTYAYLIKHESDFRIATRDDIQLIPKSISWEQFCMFARHLEAILDANVTERYQFGELRLTRLNLYVKFFLGKSSFEPIYYQNSAYFGRLYPFILFVFAILTTILNAMQVEMSVESIVSQQWQSFWVTSRYFSILVLLGVLIIVICLAITLIAKWTRDWRYILRMRAERKRADARKDMV